MDLKEKLKQLEKLKSTQTAESDKSLENVDIESLEAEIAKQVIFVIQ